MQSQCLVNLYVFVMDEKEILIVQTLENFWILISQTKTQLGEKAMNEYIFACT